MKAARGQLLLDGLERDVVVVKASKLRAFRTLEEECAVAGFWLERKVYIPVYIHRIYLLYFYIFSYNRYIH